MCLQQETGTEHNNGLEEETNTVVGPASLVGVWSEDHLV